MVKLQKKQVKIVSVLIALAFVGSVVAMALTQFGPNMASAASSNVGVVDYSQIMSQLRRFRLHPMKCRRLCRKHRRNSKKNLPT